MSVDNFFLFKPNYNLKKTYCIVIPPPNITGYLHMGHAFQCTLMDVLIRYYRINNFSVLWKMGVDHAGIATQILIKNKWPNKNIYDLLKCAYSWKKKSFSRIKKQLLNLDCSLYFKTSRFTLDNHFSYAVKKAFIDLFYQNLIYKAEKLVNWDISLQTAISDLEVVYEEFDVKLYNIKYNIFGENDKYIVVSTTRPETIFADVAIALHPSDNRLSFLKNKFVEIPIIKRLIPIIISDKVDISFGTGCLKITPGHDFNDFKIGTDHNLPLINIIDKNGFLNNSVPERYRRSIKDAKSIILEDLMNFNLIDNVINYKTKIPLGDRSNSVIEPLLTKQWYVNVKPLIDPIISLIKNNFIKIIPIKWKRDFIDWSENIKDWCISRQIWWGHRIPVWYDSDYNFYVSENEKMVRKKFNISDDVCLVQETDVLDTWFSSALWPFASLGWPIMKKEYIKFYPVNTLITGFDIIFFWVIRMLMFGLKFTGQLPFNEIYIHGLIRDNFGNKMSKTKGNVVDPIDIINGINLNNLIKKRISNLLNLKLKTSIIEITKKHFPNGIKPYGVDALRLTFLHMATENMFLRLDFRNLDKYNNFCTKLLNANFFVNSKILSKNFCYYKNNITNIYLIWIFFSFQNFKFDVDLNIKNRNFSSLIDCIYNFFWYEFCDFHIEIAKLLIKNSRYIIELKSVTNQIFNEFLLIMYPIIPNLINKIFIDLHQFSYPKIFFKKSISKYENLIVMLKKISTKIRNLKTNSTCENFFVLIKFLNFDDIKNFEVIKSILKKFCNLKNIFLFNENKIYEDHTCFVFFKFNIFVPNYFLGKKYNFIMDKIKKLNIQKNLIESNFKNNKFLEKADSLIVNYKKEKLNKIIEELNNLNNLLT